VTFKNDHLSASRLARYEECPLSFKLAYIDRLRSEPGMPAKFGIVVHKVLERLVGEHVAAELVGRLSAERGLELLQEEWTRAALVGAAEYGEAVDIVRSFVSDEGVLDPADVLGLEQPFELQAGRFKLIGYIDRADRLGDDAVIVRDYKTHRLLPERYEVDASLQLSLYAAAARKLWPWAKRVELELHELRHGVHLRTQRGEEQLESALAYAASLGEQTESSTEFAPRLNAHCIYCDHRMSCPAYTKALSGHRDVVCEDLADLEKVAQEREEVAVLAKALYARKEELDRVLKAYLEEHDELTVAGMRYRVFNVARRDFPVVRTLKFLSEKSGQPEDVLLEKLATIENKGLDALVKRLQGKLDKSQGALLKFEVDALAEKSLTSRLWSTRAA
jgi:putative RecB family exonuclease